MTSPRRPEGAPDNPEFWALSKIVCEYDDKISAVPENQRDEVFATSMTDAGIDAETVAYMATQRAMLACGVTNAVELLLYREMVSLAAASWTEAFLFGTRFATRET